MSADTLTQPPEDRAEPNRGDSTPPVLVATTMDAGTLSDPTATVEGAPRLAGRIEGELRTAVGALVPLSAVQRAHAEIAYTLARHLDAFDSSEGATGLAGVARELRAAIAAIWEGVKVERPSDALVAGLGTPAGTPQA